MSSTLGAAACGAPVVLTGFALGALTAIAAVILAFLAYMWWYDNHRKPHRPYGNPEDLKPRDTGRPR